jgi:hypothetical protein
LLRLSFPVFLKAYGTFFLPISMQGSDFASLEQELDALPVDGFGNDEMFGDMLDDGSADDDLVAHPMFCGTGSRGGGGGGSLSGSGGGRAASGASDSGKASRKGAVVDSAADWDEEEDAVLREAVLRHGLHNWQGVSKHMLPSQLHRSAAACEARWLLVKDKVVKGPWLAEEDALLRELVKEVGAKKWSVIAESIPGRAGKQCRERWLNHLDSAVKKVGVAVTLMRHVAVHLVYLDFLFAWRHADMAVLVWMIVL